MNNYEIKTDKNLSELLKKANSPKPANDFTDIIMKKVKVIAVRDRIFKRYFNRSIFFTFLSVILFITTLIAMPVFF